MKYILVNLCLGLLVISGCTWGQRRGRGRGPQIVTEAGTYQGEEGGSVTLPCRIDNLGRKSVFWMKGSDSESRRLVMQIRTVRQRFFVPRQFRPVIQSGKMATEDTNLIINELTQEDADTYSCTVTWVGQTVTHSLHVTERSTPLEVEVVADPANQEVTVVEGGDATFNCYARGYPQPTVAWFKESAGSWEGEGEVLEVRGVRRGQEGGYQCVATNGQSPDVTKTFQLNVLYVEAVVESALVVADSEDRQVQLSCRVRGHPQPQVVWYHGNEVVEEDDTHHHTSTGDLHHLQLTEVTPADLGDYQCYAYNSDARDLASLHLTSSPGPVVVMSALPVAPGQPSAIEDQPPALTNLTWALHSLSPITEYHLTLILLETGEEETRMVEVEGGGGTGGGAGVVAGPEGMMRYTQNTLLTLPPGTTYSVSVRATNDQQQQGPHMSQPFTFTVPHTQGQEGGEGDQTATWKLLQATLNLLSRLPRIVRALQ